MSARSRETVSLDDWPARTITVAEVLTGGVALIGIAAWLTLNPILLLVFLFGQPTMLVGIVLFAVAALASRTRTGPEPVSHRMAAGDAGAAHP